MNAVPFTITPSGAAVIHRASSEPENHKPIFNAAFLERRMQQHRELQERMAAELEYDIVREVLEAERGR
jgi:hypothetical protein